MTWLNTLYRIIYRFYDGFNRGFIRCTRTGHWPGGMPRSQGPRSRGLDVAHRLDPLHP